MIQFRQIKNISEGNITSSTFDPGNIDSNRKRSKKCCGFLCEIFFRGHKKQTANKMTQLFHTHAWIGGIKILTALDLLLNSCLWFRIILRDPFVDQCMKLRCCVVDTGLFVGFLEMNGKRKSVLGFSFSPHNKNLSRTRDLLYYFFTFMDEHVTKEQFPPEKIFLTTRPLQASKKTVSLAIYWCKSTLFPLLICF